jgi:oligopeptidase B
VRDAARVTPETLSEPPQAERRPHPITAHGDTRIDDWYWVRDREDPSLMPLLEAENEFTEAATAHLEPLAEEIYRSILARTELTDVSYPAPRGAWAYYTRTIEGRDYPVHCRRPTDAPPPVPGDGSADPHEQVVLDENLLAEGHAYFALGDQALDAEQRLLAYAVDTDGSERLTIRIRDLGSGEELADLIDGASYGLAFAAGGTLFYTRPDASMRPYQIWRHRLGEPVSHDVKVWEEPDERFVVGVDTTKDGELVVVSSESSTSSEWRYLPVAEPEGEARLVAARRPDVQYSIEHHSGDFVILTNDGNENFAVYLAPRSDPDRSRWEVLLEGRDDVRLEQIDVVVGHLLVEERGHATTAVRILPLPGGAAASEPRLVEAPEAGTVQLATNLDFLTTKVRVEASTLVDPPTLYELDLASGERRRLWQLPVPGYDPAAYRTERRWATSADGTRVPVTLAWHRDRPEGPGPALLYGYGSYGASSDPAWSGRRPVHPFLDRSVVYAIAHVRGGEEMGRHWYLDGKLDRKHHSFEDFVAAARFLVDEGWTTPDRLAAMGRSAGGLLVGASVNLDPGAFGAVAAEVPFVDCVTTMLDASIPLTTNEWEEWGDPVSDPAAYEWIKAYSPYDNVKPQPYPRMLVTAGLTDPRVAYVEPVKWVQRLRAAHEENRRRILLRVELSAGHFGPSGRYAGWRQRAFVAAFLLDAIGAGANAPSAVR